MKVLEKLHLNISKSKISKIRLFNPGWYFKHFLCSVEQEVWKLETSCREIVIRIGYYSIVIQYYTSCRSVSRLYWYTVTSYYPIAKTFLVWDVKVNFISNESLNNGAFPFSSALISYLIREKNNSKLPVVKSSKESVRCHQLVACLDKPNTQFAHKKSCYLARQNEFHFKIRA